MEALGVKELIEKWEKEIAQYTIDPSWVDDEWLLKAQQLIGDLKRLSLREFREEK